MTQCVGSCASQARFPACRGISSYKDRNHRTAAFLLLDRLVWPRVTLARARRSGFRYAGFSIVTPESRTAPWASSLGSHRHHWHCHWLPLSDLTDRSLPVACDPGSSGFSPSFRSGSSATSQVGQVSESYCQVGVFAAKETSTSRLRDLLAASVLALSSRRACFSNLRLRLGSTSLDLGRATPASPWVRGHGGATRTPALKSTFIWVTSFLGECGVGHPLHGAHGAFQCVHGRDPP